MVPSKQLFWVPAYQQIAPTARLSPAHNVWNWPILLQKSHLVVSRVWSGF
jgi:hypothetical protein